MVSSRVVYPALFVNFVYSPLKYFSAQIQSPLLKQSEVIHVHKESPSILTRSGSGKLTVFDHPFFVSNELNILAQSLATPQTFISFEASIKFLRIGGCLKTLMTAKSPESGPFTILPLKQYLIEPQSKGLSENQMILFRLVLADRLEPIFLISQQLIQVFLTFLYLMAYVDLITFLSPITPNKLVTICQLQKQVQELQLPQHHVQHTQFFISIHSPNNISLRIGQMKNQCIIAWISYYLFYKLLSFFYFRLLWMIIIALQILQSLNLQQIASLNHSFLFKYFFFSDELILNDFIFMPHNSSTI